ncbi:uncharacterized protein DUF2147 [Arcicella aurantiaca]|uniref:Uncharacterized protein DUF2147 n=1 Tax=Arcicella aurantiaca TaxID=591202 RepID=A0A316DQF2_9BACT|nr:DUF2147 domain-containing protein [Arcicella aurantiaca]PWK20214.1 uncharacterized protein DUF2147 [Arcicella aurantiaca]
MKFPKIFLLLFIFSSFFSFTDDSEKIVGIWFTEGKGSKIQIYKVEKEYFGKIIWIAPNAKKEDLKVKPTVGYQIFKKFTYEEKNLWTGGQVSDPRSGMTVSGKMTLKDEKTLSVRGFVGSPMFGKTVILTRAE